MNPQPEILRLKDLMPASGRMYTQLISKPEQSLVITSSAEQNLWTRLTQREKPVTINFDLWARLPQPQRDLLLLRQVSWLLEGNWFKPDLYQGLTLAGFVGTLVEVVQVDAVGTVVGGALTVLAAAQVWRANQGTGPQLEADEAAIRVAQRRGYTEADAARHLLDGIQSVAKLEGRSTLEFSELIRIQNLRALAGLSPVGVPKKERSR
ncbi:DUF3318 domain-containing protein [Leptolyngbya sp. FACHB-261]|uniref:DUF3318 domain-containing protein n=1 Tax=Leptolyngbya sp. FACHB-261 TaxID=2692806 RepID=UPI0016859C65|nr:DUF3318 domain-containing protein [Leptolyngbya sp. FACHB-261]MBD2104068.1 DUF3318 domain-containing protein [Leptolyngbya sp. FACHB-261]